MPLTTRANSIRPVMTGTSVATRPTTTMYATLRPMGWPVMAAPMRKTASARPAARASSRRTLATVRPSRGSEPRLRNVTESPVRSRSILRLETPSSAQPRPSFSALCLAGLAGEVSAGGGGVAAARAASVPEIVLLAGVPGSLITFILDPAPEAMTTGPASARLAAFLTIIVSPPKLFPPEVGEAGVVVASGRSGPTRTFEYLTVGGWVCGGTIFSAVLPATGPLTTPDLLTITPFPACPPTAHDLPLASTPWP